MYTCKYVLKELPDVEFSDYMSAIGYAEGIGEDCMIVSPSGIDVCCYINRTWITYH